MDLLSFLELNFRLPSVEMTSISASSKAIKKNTESSCNTHLKTCDPSELLGQSGLAFPSLGNGDNKRSAVVGPLTDQMMSWGAVSASLQCSEDLFT